MCIRDRLKPRSEAKLPQPGAKRTNSFPSKPIAGANASGKSKDSWRQLSGAVSDSAGSAESGRKRASASAMDFIGPYHMRDEDPELARHLRQAHRAAQRDHGP